MATSNRGFAGMDASKQKAIASKGGKARRAGSASSRASPSRSSAAGATQTAKRGGQHSHRSG